MSKLDDQVAAPAPTSPPRDAAARWLVSAAVLLMLTLIAYWPVYSAGYIWDDDSYVTENRNLLTTHGLIDTWTQPHSLPQYYPLVHTTYWLEYRLWGLEPLGYHVVNVLLHAGSALLLWRLLRRLGVPGAWLAAAIFAVHPIHVESVAWITERKNTLSALLYLSSAHLLVRFFRLPQREAYELNWRWYLPALLFFVLALCSKTVTSTLPAAALVVLWWQRGRIRLGDVGVLTPLFILGAIMGQVTSRMELYHVGAVGRDWDFSLAQRVLIAGRALWFYAGKIVWPAELVFIYPRWSLDTASLAQWSAPVLAAAVLITLVLLRKRLGRGPAAAVMLFYGTAFPALGFFNIYPMRFSFVADHFVYLASLGLITLIAVAVAWIPRASLRAGAAAVLLVALSARTIEQARWYHDAQTLWTRTLQLNPGATVAYYNLASMASQRGEHEQAIALMQQAVTHAPGNPLVLSNLGAILSRAGRDAQAKQAYEQAVSLYAAPEPEMALTQRELAGLLMHEGQFAAAAPLLRQSLAIRGFDLAARRLFVHALLESNQPLEAVGEGRRVLRQAGAAVQATDHYNLGLALHRTRQLPEAEAAYRAALAMDGDHVGALVNLGGLLASRGPVREALPLLQRAVELSPQDAAAHQNLGLALASLRQRPQAILHLRQALGLNPQQPQAARRLAWLLATDPNADEAQGREALQLALSAGDDGRAPTLDVLAACQAAAGQFEQAVQSVDRAIAAASPRQSKLIEQLQQRRALYQAGMPYRETFKGEVRR